jgi:hypothetical protein
MKRFSVLLVLFLSALLACPGADTKAIQIFSEASYVLHELRERAGAKGTWWWSKDEPPSSYWQRLQPKPVISKGSGWATIANGVPVFVTAAHVVGLNSVPYELAGKKIGERCKIIERTIRIYAGGLAFEPDRFGWLLKPNGLSPTDHADAAILVFAAIDVFKDVTVFSLADALPLSGDPVTAIGFPGTPVPQTVMAVVTYSDAAQRFFFIDRPLDDGFSGGVVLNQKGKALGVFIGNKSSRQGTVLSIGSKDLAEVARRSYSEISHPHPFDGKFQGNTGK